MYQREVYAEPHIPTLREFIKENPLGILTTAIPSSSYPLIQATHIPWVLDVQDETDENELGRLRGHIARANPQAKVMIEAIKEQLAITGANTLEQEVMILFNGPTHHYVTPKFYVETKPVSGKVAPTWNYTAVQVYGKATIFFDSADESTKAFLSKQVDDLSRQSETKIMGYTGESGKPSPWKVSDAPERYVDILKKNIIGVEVAIERLEGKFKMSQERPLGDRKGVIQGFEAMGNDIGSAMAETVRVRGELKDEGKT